ncbi:MAG: cytochrome c [Lysobacterales bacterium]
MKMLRAISLVALAGLLVAVAFVWLGIYNIAADDPHWAPTYRVMETVRTRSIATRAAKLKPPALNDKALIRSGAGNYSAMCVSCHLAPGESETELSIGLYPAPPTWSELGAVDPREAFWVIKHGVKMSGMPAWGKSMDDKYIWGMVALLQQFPRMTAAAYAALVASSSGHDHGGGESDVGVGSDAVPEDHSGMAVPDAERSSFEPIEDPMTTDAPSAPSHRDDGHEH